MYRAYARPRSRRNARLKVRRELRASAIDRSCEWSFSDRNPVTSRVIVDERFSNVIITWSSELNERTNAQLHFPLSRRIIFFRTNIESNQSRVRFEHRSKWRAQNEKKKKKICRAKAKLNARNRWDKRVEISGFDHGITFGQTFTFF